MFFQMTFAIITPALIAGALADRMKFSAFLWFMALWLLLVYCPIAHWVWGGGWLGTAGRARLCRRHRRAPERRHRGSRHLLSCSASASASARENMAPHNLVYSVIGASLLWVGWFGFNAGSAVRAGDNAGMAAAATQIATAAAACPGWSWNGSSARSPVLGMISGRGCRPRGHHPGLGLRQSARRADHRPRARAWSATSPRSG